MPVAGKNHFYIILLSVFFLPAFISAATVPYNWAPVVVGGGGFVTGIVYSPALSGLAYCRTDMGGAYRKDTAAGPWIPITDFLDHTNSDYMGILSIAPDPSDANRVYCMSGKYTASWAGNGAVLTSANKGATWAIVPLSFKVGGNEDGRGCRERLAVDPNLGSILFMGSGGATVTTGLWKSTNYGAAWAQVGAFNTTANMNFVIFDKSSSATGNATQRIFAATNNTGGQSLWVSTNGGTSWAAVAGQPNGVMAMRADISNGYLYTTWANNVGPNNATAGAVWRYQISNGAWTNISPVVGPAYGYSGISVDAQNPQHIMVSTLDLWWPYDQIWRSTNGGTSWTALMWNPANNAIIATLDYSLAPWGSIRTPHWVACLKIDPFNSARADFGTGYGLFSCDNVAAATTNWQFRNLQVEEMVPMELAAPPSGTLLFSACGDQGVFRHDSLTTSPAAGVSWNVGTALSVDYAEALPSKIVAASNATPYGGYSTNSGGSWTNFATFPGGTSGGGSKAIAVSANGNNIVWMPSGAALSYSTNNGGSWTACAGGAPAGYGPESDRVNSNKFYYYDPVNGRLWYSTNGGANFTQSATAYPALPSYSAEVGTVSAVFGREGDVWVTCGTGGLYHSTDSGVTGAKVASVTEAYMVGFGKASGAYPAIYLHGIVGGVLGIFRSDDTGATWSQINDSSHQYGWLHNIKGDQNVYGRCYISAEGRGISYGVPAGATTPTFTPTRTRTATITPVLTPTYTRTATSSIVPSSTVSPSRTATATFTRTVTPTFTVTNAVTATFTRSATPSFSATPTRSASATWTASVSPSTTYTGTLTSTPVITATFTATSSFTRTFTATYTRTQTGSPTFTRTVTSSNTGTFTPVNTLTGTPVNTLTFTQTRTNTPVNTATSTPVNTGTFTVTRTNTPANTFTSTQTNTPVSTGSASATASVSPSRTYTITETRTASVSPSNTNTRTPTFTATGTNTPANTFTNTQTNTPVNTATFTITTTGTFTRTLTATPSGTYTRTLTGTPSNTNTFTRTATPTLTFTVTLTMTASRTPTITPTWTTGFGTLTDTPTITQSQTSSASPTLTHTPTGTFTGTVSATSTVSPSSTMTATPSRTTTCMCTPTVTNTSTPTTTRSPTLTMTPANTVTITGTDTRTATATYTVTKTGTLTITQTNTITITFTPSRTATLTITLSSTRTFTPTKTESPDYSPTDTWTGTPPTETITPTITETETEIPTDTVTPSVSSTESPVSSATPTRTVTSSSTPTYTRTGTASASATASVSPQYTFTNTETRTYTPVNTATLTSTPLSTSTATLLPTGTRTATGTYTLVNTVTFTATGTATATVTLTLTGINTATPTFTGTYNPAPTSTATIGDTMEVDDVSVFPNPYSISSGNLSVSFNVTRPADIITITVYTSAFRKVAETSVSGAYLHKSAATFQARKFSRLASGVYYAVLKAENGSEHAKSKPVVLVILK